MDTSPPFLLLSASNSAPLFPPFAACRRCLPVSSLLSLLLLCFAAFPVHPFVLHSVPSSAVASDSLSLAPAADEIESGFLYTHRHNTSMEGRRRRGRRCISNISTVRRSEGMDGARCQRQTAEEQTPDDTPLRYRFHLCFILRPRIPSLRLSHPCASAFHYCSSLLIGLFP